MKKTLLIILVCILAVGVLASCDNKNTSLANEINKAYESGAPMSYEEVKSKLPLGTIWVGYDSDNGKSGVLCYVEGINSQEAFDVMIESIKAGASYEGIIVRIVNNKAVKAAGDRLDYAAYQALRQN